MAIIRMKYTLLDEIARYATGHLPEEACGLIAGSEDENGRLIEKVYYLTNVDHAEDHFTLDPKEQLSAIKDMRANGLSKVKREIFFFAKICPQNFSRFLIRD